MPGAEKIRTPGIVLFEGTILNCTEMNKFLEKSKNDLLMRVRHIIIRLKNRCSVCNLAMRKERKYGKSNFDKN